MAAASPPPAYCTDLVIYPTSDLETGTATHSHTHSHTPSLTPSLGSFRGLSNQGATCYMNSLLQTLYMTAEFRHALYQWRYCSERDGAEEYCIPLQLQKLFGLLQLSATRSVDTVALTKSFGWEGNERFQQQDVQELCRVLFDALEECFKGHADVENFIDDLYAGELIDYIKCMNVDYQSERKDKFLDYSIAIRPFGAEESLKSVTECIEHYLEPEILDGDNQYFAESVGRKVDAIKGLKFGSLPKVMAVQLKRFVFDFSGESIVQKKINDKVTFPLFLDMNKYVSKGKKASGVGVEEEHNVEDFDDFLRKRIMEMRKSGKDNSEEDKKTSNSNNLPDLVDCNGTLAPAPTPDDEECVAEVDTFDHSVDPLQLVEEKGEWVYQLYAVLVHSGAISGGHYYVYIRDTSTNKWWNFNDSSVTEVSEKTVLEAQGGFTATTSTYNSSYSSSYVRYPAVYPVKPVESCANAYMLMYRKVTAESMNVQFPGDELVPHYIKDEVKRITDEAEKKRLESVERMNKINISVLWKKKKYDIATTKTTRYKDFLQLVWSKLPIYSDENELFNYMEDKDFVPLENVRLRVYNTYHKVAGLPFLVEESGDKTLDSLKISLHRELFIEVKGREEAWETYEVDAVNILMTEYDAASDTFKDHNVIRLPKTSTLGELRKIITPPHCEPSNIRILKLLVWAYTDVKAVEFDDDTLTLVPQLQVFEGQKLYWEEITGPMESSPVVEAFRNTANQICINLKDEREKEKQISKLAVDKRWTLLQLRNHVQEKLNLEVDFRLCKFTPPHPEFTGEESKPLSSLGFYTGMTVVLKLGAPLLPGYFNFKVYKYNASHHPRVRKLGEELPVFATTSITPVAVETPAQTEAPANELDKVNEVVAPVEETLLKNTFGSDKVSILPDVHQFEFLMDYPVHGDMMIGEIRETIFQRLKSMKIMSDTDSAKRIRIRLRNGQTCGDILVDSNTLRQSKVSLFADRGLAVQILDHEEDINAIEPCDVLVFVRRWLRSTWELTPPTEILLKGETPVNQIAQSLAAQYGISPMTMKVLVVHPYSVVNICDLNLEAPSTTCEWTDPTLEKRSLSDVKWHLSFGDCIIIQDEAEPLRALTKEENQSITEAKTPKALYPSDYCETWWDDAVPAPAGSVVSGPSRTSTPVGPQPRVVQKGIVIKTQKAREMEKLNSTSGSALVELKEGLNFNNCHIDTSDNSSGCDILFGDVD